MNNRLKWIDIAKGILINLVILGHALAETSYQSKFYRLYILAFRWISVFHMPAFFIISGMLFNEGKWKSASVFAYMKRKFFSLLLPYYVLECIAVILQVAILSNKDWTSAFWDTMTFRCNLGADWFLPTLFFATCLFFFVAKMRNWFIKATIAVVILTLVNICNKEIHFQIMFGRVLIALCFIIIGHLCRDYLIKPIRATVALAMLIATVLIAVINGPVTMYGIQIYNPFLYLLGAVFGTALILSLSSRFSSELNNLVWVTSLNRAGNDSLIIMGTHQHILYIVRKLEVSINGLLPTIILYLSMVAYSNLIAKMYSLIKKRIVSNSCFL